MANTLINTPDLLDLGSATGATILPKGGISTRPTTPNFSIDYLVVAGGGGNSNDSSGGGGGGGLRTSYGSNSGGGNSNEPNLTLNSGVAYTITVGSGGVANTAGSSSVLDSINSAGGGRGSGGGTSYTAGAGGSGGGGAGGDYGDPGGAGTSNQGFAGGTSGANTGGVSYPGGGGGGAAAVGASASGSGDPGGNGGAGLAVNILNATNAATASVGEVDSSNVYYAGGGGGSTYQGTAGNGGVGGGGNGDRSDDGTAANNGTANTGGGGGGTNATGGSGVVILRYPTANVSSFTVTGTLNTPSVGAQTQFTEGSDTIIVFKAGTGTITFSIPGNESDATNGVFRFNTDTNLTEFFDGTNWEEVTDQYASGYNGIPNNYFDTKLYTGNGSTQSIGGYINGAGSFNGSSSIISVPDLKSVLNNNFSVSFWWKPELMNTFQVPIGGLYDETGGAAYGWMVYQGSDNKMYLYWIISISPNTSNAFSNNTVLTQGSWYHIVATKSSTGAALYVNKADAASSPSAGSVWNIEYTTNPNFYFGKRNVSNNYANGTLDQVRLYDTILTQTNVDDLYDETAATATTAAYPSGQTAVATYTMDTSANGLLTTTDLSTVNYPAGAGCFALYEMNGNSNDTSGTYNGTPTDISYQGGVFDQAAVFNGSSSDIILPQNTAFDLNGAGSFSLWVNRNNSSQTWIFEKANGGSGTYGWQLYQISNEYKFQMHDTSDNVITLASGTSGIALNTWEHIVITSSASKVYKMYINGVLKDTQTLSGTVSVNTNGARFGEYSLAGGYNFSGEIDQARFFNTELTQSQVTTLARGIATSYSGTSTDVNFNGYLNFQPGLTWVKARDAAHDHVLVDSVNGAGSNKGLSSNANYTEGTYTATYGYISSLNLNGFTVAAGSSNANYTNANNEDYVSWNWKGGGAAVTNNDGTISSSVSANKDSGFSIATYTGNSTMGATIGHGLETVPELIFVKLLSGLPPKAWTVYASALGADEYMYLDYNYAAGPYNFWNSTLPTSSVFSVSTDTNVNSSSGNYVAYCWHSVAGFSKIGTFVGTGTTTGNVVTVGFEPRFLLVKSTTYAGTNWIILDKARTPNNPMENDLNPNLANAEQTGTGNNYPQATTTSTTFQCNTTDGSINSSGQTYLYLAIA